MVQLDRGKDQALSLCWTKGQYIVTIIGPLWNVIGKAYKIIIELPTGWLGWSSKAFSYAVCAWEKFFIATSVAPFRKYPFTENKKYLNYTWLDCTRVNSTFTWTKVNKYRLKKDKDIVSLHNDRSINNPQAGKTSP